MTSGPPLLLLWGARGHALVLADLAVLLGARVVVVVDNDPDATSPLVGAPLAIGLDGFDQWVASGPAQPAGAFALAMGGSRGLDRLHLHDQLVARGLAPLALVHPAAHVAASATLGDGVQVLAGAVVSAAAELGRQVIINTSASVDHECLLGDGVHIAPGATLAGCVEVGAGSFIGAGATVLPRVRVGTSATVGAGAVVTKDVADGATVVGVPARPLR